MNITVQCHQRESQVIADLRKRECVVCHPTLSETIDMVNVCDDVLTDDCIDDPLARPWSKMCDTKSDWSSNGVRFMFGGGNEESPLSNSTNLLKTSNTEDVSDILDFINQQIIAESRDPNEGLIFPSSTTKPQASIYFDPVLNTRALQNHDERGFHSSFTEHLNSMMQRTVSKQTTVPPPTFTPSSTISTSLSNKNPKKHLTPADFLRLCFVNQIGCDFSEDGVQNEHINALTTTETPLVSRAESRSQVRDPRNFNSGQKLKEMIRLCFVTGICGSSESQSKETDSKLTLKSKTQKQAPKTLSPRQRVLQSAIEERARACFYEGKCL